MNTDRETLEFVKKRFGHTWQPVSVDESEYGMLGEPISIMPTNEQYSATHLQSPLMSEEVAAQVADQLANFGFTNPAHFTKVDTGAGIVLLLTQEGLAFAKGNQDLITATTHLPIIQDTGTRQRGQG